MRCVVCGGSEDDHKGWDHTFRARLDGHHIYLSTACLHGEHAYCKSNVVQELIPHWADDDSEILTRRKKPAECKFCFAPCVCECHKERDEA